MDKLAILGGPKAVKSDAGDMFTWPIITEEDEAAALEVLRRGAMSGTDVTVEFEKEYAAWFGSNYALGHNTGTSSIHSAMFGCGVGAGDEIIVQSMTFWASALQALSLGATIIYADIDPDTLTLDPTDVERKITDKTKAIVVVHYFGYPTDMDPIMEIAKRHDLAVIEDAAQAIGSEYNGRRAGSMAEIGCFSFFPTKNLGACGDGGLVTCQDAELAEKIRILRVHGGAPKYYHGVIGGNFRLDALQAALIRPRLSRLDDSSQQRAENAAAYTRLLTEAGLTEGPAPALRLPAEPPSRHIYNQYTLRCQGPDTRDALREFLAESEVASEIYYPVPLHLQKCFSDLGGKVGDLPTAEKLAGEVLSIPIFAELEEEELSYVADRVEAFFKTS